MKNILLVKSSVRDGRLADKIEQLVRAELANYSDINIDVADFKATPLPFFDSKFTPTDENFSPEDKNVIDWTGQVAKADAVLILTAEYNHSYTSVLKNAIDWIYKEWQDKPVAFVGYGWVGGARAINHLRGVFEFLKPKLIEPEANLRFQQEIELDGSVIDEASTKRAINAVLQEL